MNIKPIPIKLLSHQIRYEEYASSDGWDSEFKDPIIISNVRIDPFRKLKRTTKSESINTSHILIIDRINSSSFHEFKERSKITWNNKIFEITKVNPIYGFNEIHHYELELK